MVIIITIIVTIILDMDTKLNNKFEMHTKVRVALISLNYIKIQFWLLHFGVTVNMVPTFWLLSISYRLTHEQKMISS